MTSKVIVHRYGPRHRPPGLGAVPKGFLPYSDFVRSTPDFGEYYRFGYLDYPQELSEEDTKSYELDYIGPTENVVDDWFVERYNLVKV